ncbi:alpha/beta-hydrolase [Pseudovirgaria hyperparasitica]|uniref:Alpha/beta-hydrolase n=1 Tax=Pseudovirgaria hyperparasitica TaxID=470096 RepID=A0A6A6W3H2_9PEZI|nr:alpha/beta-hydrolase [Pseudovirgaria hyperparasitica]KAF2756480.1 alpha/beta-hydrolase [Pseudovirgaria hyperparasitica]
MMLFCTRLFALVAVAFAGVVVARRTCVDGSLVAHNGSSVGYERVFDGVNMYVSEPEKGTARDGVAVLYLTDVFGIQLLQNRLLADSFARAGYLTLAPDLFNGTPAPVDLTSPGTPAFNTSAFLAQHAPNTTDPLVTTALNTLHTHFHTSRIAITGYCFGGRYALRFLSPTHTPSAQVAYAAHPSLLEDGEIQAVGGPVGVAFAEVDGMVGPERRGVVEGLLGGTGVPYVVGLFGGTSHGFGVRANESSKKRRREDEKTRRREDEKTRRREDEKTKVASLGLTTHYLDRTCYSYNLRISVQFSFFGYAI